MVNLKKYILEDRPRELNFKLDTMSDLAKARYIYIELCRYFSYNNIYNITVNEEEKQQMFDEDINIENVYINPENPTENRTICSIISKACVQLFNTVEINANSVNLSRTFNKNIAVRIYSSFSEMCARLLKAVGIKSDLVNLSTQTNEHKHRHMAVRATLNINGKDINFKLDPIYDLCNVQTGSRTDFFQPNCNSENDKINYRQLNEQISEIDESIGYTYHGLYLNDAIFILHYEIEKICNILNGPRPLSNENMKFICEFLGIEEQNEFPIEQKNPVINRVKNQWKSNLATTYINNENDLYNIFLEKICEIFGINKNDYTKDKLSTYIIDFVCKVFRDYHLGTTEGNNIFLNFKTILDDVDFPKENYQSFTYVVDDSKLIKLYIINNDLYLLSDNNFARRIILTELKLKEDTGISISYKYADDSDSSEHNLELDNFHNRDYSNILQSFYQNSLNDRNR